MVRAPEPEGDSMNTETITPDRLQFTPEIAAATADVWSRIQNVVPEVEWPVHAPRSVSEIEGGAQAEPQRFATGVAHRRGVARGSCWW